jgi:glycosyltransferase involved in cell wall biosynthesis
MRIAFVNATHRWGGVKTWTLSLAGRFRARGHEVSLFLRRDDAFAVACRREGLAVETLRFGPDWNPFAVRRLRRRFRELGTEAIVTNVSKDNRVGGAAARSLGIPVLQMVGGPGDLTDRARVRLEQAKLVNHVVVPSRSVRAALDRFPWMETERRVTVVPNGIDLQRFRPGQGTGTLRRELGLPPEVPLLVTTAQLTAIKGHALLLEALDGLPGVHLAMTSRGREEPRLRARAAEAGLAGRVHFLGFRDDLPLVLEDPDLAVQPSFQEGLPLSVLEFMAKGKATVASRLDGIAEAIEDGVHGVLVPPGDVPALRDAIARLLADPARRGRLGEAARARVRAEFDLERTADRVEGILAALIDAANPAAVASAPGGTA